MKNARKRSILLVGPLPPPPGGIATAVSTLLRSSLVEDFKFVHLDNSTKRPVNKKGKIDLLNIASFIFQISLLIVKIVRHRPNLVQIETASGISFLKNSIFVLLSKAAFRKIIISIYGPGPGFIEFFHDSPTIGRRYLKFVLSRCAVVRIESEQWVKAFSSELELEESKICAIPNVVWPEDFSDNTSPTNRSRDEMTLLFLGWVGEAKGIFDLVDSIEILAHKGYQFKLLIVGPEMRKGDTDKVIKVIVDKHLDKYAKVLGETERSEVVEYYHAADVYLLPSYTEGLPLAILEAMAAGLPIVSTRVGAIPQVVEEGVNGFLVDPGDVEGLVSRLEILIKNEKLREEMGASNRTKILEEYSSDKQVKMFRCLYSQILGGKTDRR